MCNTLGWWQLFGCWCGLNALTLEIVSSDMHEILQSFIIQALLLLDFSMHRSLSRFQQVVWRVNPSFFFAS